MKQTIQVPGKLFLSGEWSVLDPGHSALVGAFDRYVYCELEAADTMRLQLPDFKLQDLAGTYADRRFQLTTELDETGQKQTAIVRHAVETALQFLEEMDQLPEGFNLLTDAVEHSLTLRNGTSAKVGLGSSAAITVGVVGSFLKQAGFDLGLQDTKDVIFKLAAIAHYRAQGKVGSGGDIAACTYGGVVHYQRFDPALLQGKLPSPTTPLIPLLEQEWSGLKIAPVLLPKELQLTAGFSGTSSSTTELIGKVNHYKQSQKDAFQELMEMIGETTTKLLEVLQEGKIDFVLNLIEANQLCLKTLGDNAGVALETPAIAEMVEIAKKHEGAAKLSGAGGGDSVIAATTDQFLREDIEWAWEEAGYYPLDVFVAKQGVSLWF